ncbi:HET-domain-containing protein [Curvularia clavata]|uniref:HET-domain-containing protein n=1 Tax=Curvularia clavata TaxID=95742 RepID=A0A9Q8YZH4_CURCL|nr:HET-domain-containing protein [Curvularia clavata]
MSRLRKTRGNDTSFSTKVKGLFSRSSKNKQQYADHLGETLSSVNSTNNYVQTPNLTCGQQGGGGQSGRPAYPAYSASTVNPTVRPAAPKYALHPHSSGGSGPEGWAPPSSTFGYRKPVAQPPHRTNDGRGQSAVGQQQQARSQPSYVDQPLQSSAYPTHISENDLQVHPVQSGYSSSASQRSREERNITAQYVTVDDDSEDDRPTIIVIPASVLNEIREGRSRIRPPSLVMGSKFRVGGTTPPSVHTIDESEDEEDYPTNDMNQESMRSIDPGPNTSVGGVNLNRRFDYMPASMVPMWYIKNPDVEPQGTPGYLCATCRHINFIALFRQQETEVPPKPRDYIMLGTLGRMIIEHQGCGFCQLAGKIIALDIVKDLPRNMDEDEKRTLSHQMISAKFGDLYSLCPVRFKTSHCQPALYLCSNKALLTASKQSVVLKPEVSMAIRPIVRNSPNCGRLLLQPDQIDFNWIRDVIRQCDLRDVRSPYQHATTVRAIDVFNMCVTELNHNVRYVTLSYTWGEAEQVKLLKDTYDAMTQPGALLSLMDRIPKTIRDSITLTLQIGERYLWVDALCIIQDDPVDKATQIGKMGRVYKNSILTVCVCCGDDADYGIPGIEHNTRTLKQAAQVVGGIALGNILPCGEQILKSTWSTRGWTMQEKVLSQRKLQISDHGVNWWCWHTSTAEDENCRHAWWDEGTAHRGMFFYEGEDDRVVSKIGRSCNMDIFAVVVMDYTSRNLTLQEDAERAMAGVLDEIQGLFRGTFVHALPDTELAASLMWSALGKSRRRVDTTTGKALFPSWSWLGWIGQAAWPWLIERSYPMSELGSPLLWRNLLADPDADEEDLWLTGTEYRMPYRARAGRWTVDEAESGWTWIDDADNGRRWLHPVSEAAPAFHRDHRIALHSSHRLHIRTLSARFRIDRRVRRRAENHDYKHKVYHARVVNNEGFYAGYVYLPDLETMTEGDHNIFDSVGDDNRAEFIVISRASGNSDPRIGRELLTSTPISELGSVYTMPFAHTQHVSSEDEDEETGHVDPLLHFDTRLYDETMPWGLFNVMMIVRDSAGGVAQRVTVGRIHVAAFMNAGPVERDILLE